MLLLLVACAHAPADSTSGHSDDSLPVVGDDSADTHDSPDSADTGVDCGEIPLDEPGYAALYDAGVVHTFAFTLSSGATAGLAADPASYVLADLTVDGTVVNNVGLRMRGDSTQQRWDGKPGFKVDLRAYDNCDAFASVEHLILNAGLDDPTQSREVISATILAEGGLVVPRATFAEVTVNGEAFGLYTSVEAVDQAFVQHHYGVSTGVLWEGGDDADFSGRGQGAWDDVGGGGDTADIEAVTTLVASTGDDFYAQVDALVDMDQLLTEWAWLAVVGHLGAFPYATKDIYLYQPADDGRFEFVPWGLDEGWDPGFGWNYSETALGLRCVYDPTCSEALKTHIEVAFTTSEPLDVPSIASSAFTLSDAAMEADLRRGTPTTDVSAARSALSVSITGWPAFVRGQLQ